MINGPPKNVRWAIFSLWEMDPGCGKWTPQGSIYHNEICTRGPFSIEKNGPKNECVELTCTVFPPSPLGSAENDFEMQNSGSVEMCRGH